MVIAGVFSGASAAVMALDPLCATLIGARRVRRFAGAGAYLTWPMETFVTLTGILALKEDDRSVLMSDCLGAPAASVYGLSRIVSRVQRSCHERGNPGTSGV
jgi:hypothetical protein